MKKLIFVSLAVLFIISSVFAAGDLNIKIGIDALGNTYINDTSSPYAKERIENSFGTNASVSFAGEYLFPVHKIIKVGGGLEYLLHREFKMDDKNKSKISYLPIYATIQVNPLEDSGLFFKGNIGYSVLLDIKDSETSDKKGNIYFALSTGYEFDFGFLFEVGYSYYKGSVTGGRDNNIDLNYSKMGINLGYKFKL